MAIRIGLSIDYYNEITPHELNLHIQAYNEQLQHERQQGLTLAYLTAYWGRVKKMPSLKSLLDDMDSSRSSTAKTDEQLLRMVRQLNAAMGGKEVKREIGK